MLRSTPQVWMVRTVSLLAVSVSALGLIQCRRAEQTPPPQAAQPAAKPAPSITPTPSLDRAALAEAIEAAASAFAAGAVSQGPDPLTGRAFDVRLPFACGGVQPARASEPEPTHDTTSGEDGLATARWSADGRTIRLSLTPADWTRSPLLATGAAGTAWETIEGVWIARPWLHAPGCPAMKGDPLQTAAAPASPQTAGLAIVFDTDGSRVGRRNGRSYTFAVHGEDGAPPAAPQGGYRLRLAGRLVGFPDGRAIRCSAAGPDQRPVCVAAVRLDTAAFETADGQVLSTWASD